MILQFGGNPRIGKFWWLGDLEDLVGFPVLVNVFWFLGLLVIGKYLVEFLSARHFVEIPELETLDLGTLVVGNLGGWKLWW